MPDMERAGFKYADQFVTENSRLFRAVEDNEVCANIHFFPVRHPHNDEMLGLRNYLRTHPEEVSAYSKMKSKLYLKYPNDYASYRKYKDEYVDNLNKRVFGE